ncbi:MAG: beta-N-acetylhexosaminidase [Proteobacteria bacterium]|nr:beta-N-acetylhexosaminidase [Pseudomonadota bacterium]
MTSGTPGGRRPRAVILGCGGEILSAAERRFFAKTDPLGFILFARNCREPDQVRRLVADLRDSVGRADAPVMIDQEGGRVARLKPPHWRVAPAPMRFADLASIDDAQAAARLNARLIADELFDLGITVNCAPVLDVRQPDADPIIGDRAYGATPDMVSRLGAAACDGFLDGGVLPVIKHLPGHGRANADSHIQLPVVDAPRDQLERIDFPPFRALRRMPWAFTAHVVYTALDDTAPATTSAKVIAEVIRGDFGYDGLLMTDDLSMQALSGSLAERTRAALAAGCDLAVHCNGRFDEMEEVAMAATPMTDVGWERFERAEAMRRPPAPFDRTAALATFDRLMAQTAGTAA